MAMAYINDESVEDTRVIGNGYIEYKPFSWLSWRTEIGADIYNSFSNIRKGDLPDNLTGVVGNQATESTTLNYKTVVNNLLNVNKMFGHDHFLQGIIGQSYEYTKERITSVAGDNFSVLI